MDPWEFRYKNVVRPGDSLPNGQICSEETALAECLEAVKMHIMHLIVPVLRMLEK